MSRREFARREGYSPSTLAWWATELRRRGEAPGRTSTVPTLVRVVPRSAPPAAALVLEVGRVRISVARGFDAALLRDVVAALEAR